MTETVAEERFVEVDISLTNWVVRDAVEVRWLPTTGGELQSLYIFDPDVAQAMADQLRRNPKNEMINLFPRQILMWEGGDSDRRPGYVLKSTPAVIQNPIDVKNEVMGRALGQLTLAEKKVLQL